MPRSRACLYPPPHPPPDFPPPWRRHGTSSHQRPLFQQIARDERYDVAHIRYNAAHPGAEQDIFPHLDEAAPGIASFTCTRWGDLLRQGPMDDEEMRRMRTIGAHVHEIRSSMAALVG